MTNTIPHVSEMGGRQPDADKLCAIEGCENVCVDGTCFCLAHRRGKVRGQLGTLKDGSRARQPMRAKTA